MMRRLGCAWIVMGSFVFASCAKEKLPDYNRLGGLRVLAMKADQPEIAPGSTVSITPVVSDIAGAGRALNWVAVGCTDPGSIVSSDPSCDDARDRVELGTGTLAPALVAPVYTQAVDPISVTIPLTILENRNSINQINGVSYLVTYVITAADGSTIKAYKRLVVSMRTQKNTNPMILEILSNHAPISALPLAPEGISLDFSESSTENYGSLTSDGVRVNQTETLLVTWFVSDGDFEQMRVVGTSENLYSPPKTLPTGHSVVIVAVVRDGRGGEDFRILGLSF